MLHLSSRLILPQPLASFRCCFSLLKMQHVYNSTSSIKSCALANTDVLPRHIDLASGQAGPDCMHVCMAVGHMNIYMGVCMVPACMSANAYGQHPSFQHYAASAMSAYRMELPLLSCILCSALLCSVVLALSSLPSPQLSAPYVWMVIYRQSW